MQKMVEDKMQTMVDGILKNHDKHAGQKHISHDEEVEMQKTV